jgi:exonuclease VII large subunit
VILTCNAGVSKQTELQDMQDTVAQYQKQLDENQVQLQAARSEMFASHKEASEARRRLQEQQQQQRELPTEDSSVGTSRGVLVAEDVAERTAVPLVPAQEPMLGEAMPGSEDGHADPLTQKLLLSVQKKDQTLTLVREDLDRVLVKLESKEMEVNKLRDTVEQIAPLQKLVKLL